MVASDALDVSPMLRDHLDARGGPPVRTLRLPRGVMTRARSKGRRPVRLNALGIRAWVTTCRPDEGEWGPLEPDDIHQRLRQKVEAVDRAMRPFADYLDGLLLAVEPVTVGGAAARAAMPPEQRCRVMGYFIIADYFTYREPEHPEHRGKRFPSIVWRGEPWEIRSPNRIHALDLDESLINKALRDSPLIAELRAAAQSGQLAPGDRPPPSGDPDKLTTLKDLDRAAETVIPLIELDPVSSVFYPGVLALRFELVQRVHDDQRSHDERARASEILDRLDAPLRGDFARHRSRSGDALLDLRARFEALRDDGRPSADAIQALMRQEHESKRSIQGRLADGGRYKAIQQAWADYVEAFRIAGP